MSSWIKPSGKPIQIHSVFWLLIIFFGGYGFNLALMLSSISNESDRVYTLFAKAGLAGTSLGGILLALLVPRRSASNFWAVGSVLAFWMLYVVKALVYWDRIGFVTASFDGPEYILMQGIGGCLLPCVALALLEPPKNENSMLVALLLPAAIAGGIMFWTHQQLILTFERRWTSGHEMESGFAMHPLSIGYQGSGLVLLSLIGFATWKRGSWKWQLISIPCFVLGLMLIVGSASRGPVLAVACAIFAWIARRALASTRWLFVGIVLGMLVVLGTLLAVRITGSSVIERLTETPEAIELGGVSASRVEIFWSCWEEFRENILFGGNLVPVGAFYAHNMVLEVLMSTGIVGGILWSIAVYFFLRSWWNGLAGSRGSQAVSMLGVAYTVGGMVSWSIYTNFCFWILGAAAISLYGGRREAKLSPDR